MPDVLILGCGPAGLLAAHAVERAGLSPAIMSIKQPSPLHGAQYLHEPIPGLTGEPDGIITTVRRGTREGYAAKVYGDPAAPCSWDDQHETRAAWDLRRIYAALWERYQPRIVDTRINRQDLNELDLYWKLVISTIPATQLCYRNGATAVQYGNHQHEFSWEKMYILDWAPPELPDNTVLYSGVPEHDWYRASRVFGHVVTEATQYCFNDAETVYAEPPSGSKIITPKTGIKVKGTTCDCFPGIKRVGRYGTWSKGYLTHHAFADATRLCEEAFA